MATPLKLWQHSEPKRLWPALGGLSVLVHIGILGLSLPYVLALMQASDSNSAETIPIELVVVSPETESLEPVNEPYQEASPTAKAQDSPPPVPAQTVSANNTVFQESENESTAAPVRPSSERNEAVPQGPAPDSKSPANNSSSSSTELKNELDNEKTNNSSEDGSQTNEPQTDELPAEGSGKAGEAPIVPASPGEPSLPSPGESANNQQIPQSAALRIVDYSQVGEMQRDVGKTPPKPKEKAIATTIELDPIAQGCGRIEFSQQQWTYRIKVGIDGSVSQATIYTGGIARDISEEERAIACLIESAGFEFEPALFDGKPILDDNLLLTISVIEVP